MSTLSVRFERPHPVGAAGGQERSRRTARILDHLRVWHLDEATRNGLITQLIETNVGMAKALAARYRNRGIDLEDLEQVAMLALTKAAHRFDPRADNDFMSYAVPTIRGELRRHFRDAGWMVRPPRKVQELQADISRVHDKLHAQLGRSPRPTEVAAHLGVELDNVIEALTADGCFIPASLDTPLGEDRSEVLGDLLPCDDRDLESAEARLVLSPALRGLNVRELLILRMRFAEQRTQQEIGEAVGLNQAQVSRYLARLLKRLRAELGDVEVASTTGLVSPASAAGEQRIAAG